jgi:hypothetical protein
VGIWGTGGFLLLAVALDDLCHSLLPINLAEVFVLLRLDALSPAPHNSVALFPDSSFISCHPPLPAGGELAGVWLGEGSSRGCSSTPSAQIHGFTLDINSSVNIYLHS